MLATIRSAVLVGTDGQPVTVEVHESGGIPSFNIVGLPDTSCREARDRVRAALLSSGFGWPQQRVTVNLAPSGVRKVGASLDLAVAVGVLVVTGALPASSIDGIACIGELGLDGSVRPVPGTLSLVDALTTPVAVVASESAAEARLVGRHDVKAVGTLAELVRAVLEEEPWPPAPATPTPEPPRPVPDLRDVRGQPTARLALEVAAAGLHHLLLVGPPGVGKTMLAARLPGLLPRLERSAALEVTRIHSAAGRPLPPGGLIEQPAFRSPHHTATAPALIGGGSGHLRPGEISLAHRGVLFLDELAEFPAHVLDALRQPLEEGTVRVSRSRASVSFRARFLLVAAMNPCPCGQGGPPGSCRCSEAARARHARRISGPLLDRFDLRVRVDRPDIADLLDERAPGEATAVVADRVAGARARAAARGVIGNAQLEEDGIERAVTLSSEASEVLEAALRSGRLSARGLARTRRVAQTVADLTGGGDVTAESVALALSLRADPVALSSAG